MIKNLASMLFRRIPQAASNSKKTFKIVNGQFYKFSTQNNKPEQTINILENDKLSKEELIKKEIDKNEQILLSIEDYKSGLNNFVKGKYRTSLDQFMKVKKFIENNNETHTNNYLLVLKKLAQNLQYLRKYEDAEKYLEHIIDHVQKSSSNDAIVYREYNNLFIHCIKYNLNKAIVLGKALLSEQEKTHIPVGYQKLFTFNLGTSYLLKGNLVDAKKRFREVLIQEPNHLLKGYALNNLAVASWWHKYPNFMDEEETTDEDEGAYNDNIYKQNKKVEIQEKEYSPEQIDKDFEVVIPLFKRALYHIENVENKPDFQIQQLLKVLLDQDKIVPENQAEINPELQMLLTHKDCGIPMLNIKEFLFNTQPELRNEAMYWFKYATKFFMLHDPQNSDRCIITLGLFCKNFNQYQQAEGLFKKALEMLEGSDSYNKVLALQLYGKLLKKAPNRESEGEKLLAKAYEVADNLPFWSNKLIHICVPREEF